MSCYDDNAWVSLASGGNSMSFLGADPNDYLGDYPATAAERRNCIPGRKPAPLQNVLRTLPSSAADRKNAPVMTGMVDYFPLAVAEIAKISKAGNDQHNPGQPLHWARGKSTDHADCVLRHMIERGTIDTDGQRHTAKAAWRVLALLQEELEAAAGWTPDAEAKA